MLLAGAALGALVAGRRSSGPGAPGAHRSRIVSAAVLVEATLVVETRDAWLYRGGFLSLAVVLVALLVGAGQEVQPARAGPEHPSPGRPRSHLLRRRTCGTGPSRCGSPRSTSGSAASACSRCGRSSPWASRWPATGWSSSRSDAVVSSGSVGPGPWSSGSRSPRWPSRSSCRSSGIRRSRRHRADRRPPVRPPPSPPGSRPPPGVTRPRPSSLSIRSEVTVQVIGNSLSTEIRPCLGQILDSRGARMETVAPPDFLICRDLPDIEAQATDPATRPDAAVIFAFLAYDDRCGAPWHASVDALIDTYLANDTHVFLVPSVSIPAGGRVGLRARCAGGGRLLPRAGGGRSHPHHGHRCRHVPA